MQTDSKNLLSFVSLGYRDQEELSQEATVQEQLAFLAGKALHDSGRTAPVSCKPGRGKVLLVETAGGSEYEARPGPAGTASLQRVDR